MNKKTMFKHALADARIFRLNIDIHIFIKIKRTSNSNLKFFSNMKEDLFLLLEYHGKTC